MTKVTPFCYTVHRNALPGGELVDTGERVPLQDIKRGIEALVGERVRATTSKGRRQVIEREGTLEKTYPSLFVIRIDGDAGRRISFTYVDVLTEMVKLSVCNEDSQEPFPASR